MVWKDFWAHLLQFQHGIDELNGNARCEVSQFPQRRARRQLTPPGADLPRPETHVLCGQVPKNIQQNIVRKVVHVTVSLKKQKRLSRRKVGHDIHGAIRFRRQTHTKEKSASCMPNEKVLFQKQQRVFTNMYLSLSCTKVCSELTSNVCLRIAHSHSRCYAPWFPWM